jgi:hypothetical protein
MRGQTLNTNLYKHEPESQHEQPLTNTEHRTGESIGKMSLGYRQIEWEIEQRRGKDENRR